MRLYLFVSLFVFSVCTYAQTTQGSSTTASGGTSQSAKYSNTSVIAQPITHQGVSSMSTNTLLLRSGFIHSAFAPPAQITLSSDSIAEGSDGIVGNLSTLDPNKGDRHTYTILDEDQGFEILDNQLKVADDFDFSAKDNYQIVIKSTDTRGLFFSSAFDISVTAQNGQTTSTLSNTIKNLDLYPNPSKGNINLRIENMILGTVHFEVYDLVAQLRLKGSYQKRTILHHKTLNLSPLKQGTYFIVLSLQEHRTVKRIMIK